MNKQMKDFCEKKNSSYDYYSEITYKRIKSPITVLIGPNGTGKSMSLRGIKSYLKKNKIKYVSYSTSKDDIVSRGSSPFGSWDISKIACAFHSEGERMTDSFFDWANSDMLRGVLEDKECPLFVLIDEADSGLSIDRLHQTLEQIVYIAKTEHERGRDIHFIFTCNSYEMLECLQSDITDVIWVPTKQSVHIKSYEKFKKPYIEYFEVMHHEDE